MGPPDSALIKGSAVSASTASYYTTLFSTAPKAPLGICPTLCLTFKGVHTDA